MDQAACYVMSCNVFSVYIFWEVFKGLKYNLMLTLYSLVKLSLLATCALQLRCVLLFVTLWTVACQAPLSMGVLQGGILAWVAMPSSRGSSNPGIKPRSLALKADSLSSEPQGKPKNTGVGSLFLLQGKFLTQDLT